MAVTAVTTSTVTELGGFPGGYSLDVLDRMFLYKEPPCQIGVVDAIAANAWASNTANSLLAAPGAGKSLYIWGASVIPNSTGTAVGYIVLCESVTVTAGVIITAFANLPIPSTTDPRPGVGDIQPIRHTVTTNTLVAGVNLRAATALCRIRLFYAVLPI